MEVHHSGEETPFTMVRYPGNGHSMGGSKGIVNQPCDMKKDIPFGSGSRFDTLLSLLDGVNVCMRGPSLPSTIT